MLSPLERLRLAQSQYRDNHAAQILRLLALAAIASLVMAAVASKRASVGCEAATRIPPLGGQETPLNPR